LKVPAKSPAHDVDQLNLECLVRLPQFAIVGRATTRSPARPAQTTSRMGRVAPSTLAKTGGPALENDCWEPRYKQRIRRACANRCPAHHLDAMQCIRSPRCASTDRLDAA
jgi:hypothetical protein